MNPYRVSKIKAVDGSTWTVRTDDLLSLLHDLQFTLLMGLNGTDGPAVQALAIQMNDLKKQALLTDNITWVTP